MKKVIRLTESDLARIVKRVIKEQAPTDVYNQSSMGQVSGEPSMGRAKSNEFDWKSHFDQIKNELDSYLNTIEGPVDVKRFQSKVMNTYYQMVSNVDDEYSYPSHGRDFQQLTTDFMSYFTNKLKELIQNYGKLTESDLARIVKRVISEEEEMSKKLRGNYRIRSWGPNAWYDEDDRPVNPLDIEDFEEEIQFGRDDYEKFLDYTKDIPNRWDFKGEKRYYDQHYNPGRELPLKIRKLRGK